jgi:hypothetical protein
MNITKKLLQVFVIPDSNGYQNVISRVIWQMSFEEDGCVSDASIETFLPTDNLQNFIPANQVGNDRLLQWAYDIQGGDAFFESIKEYHAQQIVYEKMKVGTQNYFEGFDFAPISSNNVTTVGAQTL